MPHTPSTQTSDRFEVTVIPRGVLPTVPSFDTRIELVWRTCPLRTRCFEIVQEIRTVPRAALALRDQCFGQRPRLLARDCQYQLTPIFHIPGWGDLSAITEEEGLCGRLLARNTSSERHFCRVGGHRIVFQRPRRWAREPHVDIHGRRLGSLEQNWCRE